MRPAGKARRVRIPGVFERGATQPDGMQRRPNAAGLSPRAAGARLAGRLPVAVSDAEVVEWSRRRIGGCMLASDMTDPTESPRPRHVAWRIAAQALVFRGF